MKKRIYIMFAMLAVLFATSCNKSNVSDLRLDGKCDVEILKLDEFNATIMPELRRIIVNVPETYNTSAMKVTNLKLSDGATTNIAIGQTINADADLTLHVTNNDLYLDWILTVKRDEAKIYFFTLNDLYNGIIDEEKKTINVYVPKSVDLTSVIPTIGCSENATVSPMSGVPVNLSEPKVFTVDNGTAHSEYLVTAIAISKPTALFVGAPAGLTDLDPESKTACQWMLSNIPNSLYVSFADIQAGNIDLSECKVIWWHYHMDGGVDGHDPFIAKTPYAMDAKNQMRDFYEKGGSFLFTRYATIYPSFIGVTGDDEWTTPQNCWGGNEDSAELCGGPWDFKKYDASHPLFANTIDGDDPGSIYTTDKGYHITNSTAQYHIGADWGGFPTHESWVERTHGKIIGVGGDGAIVAWEYPAHDGKGKVLCIGSGCYDWYSYTYEEGYVEKFHKNIEIMTMNAFNYLLH